MMISMKLREPMLLVLVLMPIPIRIRRLPIVPIHRLLVMRRARSSSTTTAMAKRVAMITLLITMPWAVMKHGGRVRMQVIVALRQTSAMQILRTTMTMKPQISVLATVVRLTVTMSQRTMTMTTTMTMMMHRLRRHEILSTTMPETPAAMPAIAIATSTPPRPESRYPAASTMSPSWTTSGSGPSTWQPSTRDLMRLIGGAASASAVVLVQPVEGLGRAGLAITSLRMRRMLVMIVMMIMIMLGRVRIWIVIRPTLIIRKKTTMMMTAELTARQNHNNQSQPIRSRLLVCIRV
mmetsp:Transcript_8249/g.17282  ORF Transcript_8249/g.17282 Transcript_8249/m.17282 type:complete len:293 (-) Transcript_8249:3511-4389(-)